MHNNSTTILLVEDNIPDARYTQELLPAPDYSFIEAVTLAQALACVRSKHIDVVLLDLSLPDSHGLKTLEQLISQCEVPIVVLTGLEDIAIAVETLKVGACDYIVKNRLSPESLARSIAYAIESTKLKSIEVQLVEAEQRLRLALEGAHTGTWVRLFERGQFLCDAQAQALFGVDNSFGQTFEKFLALVHPDDRHILVKASAANSGKIDIEIEYRVVWPDGSVHWIASRGKTTFDESSKPIRAAGICVDIGARKQAQKERSQLAAIVESSEAAIIGETLDDIVTSWNQAAEKIYGYSADEMLGKSITVLFSNDARLEMAAFHERVIRGEYIDQYEGKLIRKDGVSIDCALSISPLKNESGTIIGLSTIVRDISSRKRTERLRAVQQAVTILLLESDSLAEVATDVIRLVAESLEFSAGQIWQVDSIHNDLRNAGVWHKPDGSYEDFSAMSQDLTFAQGQDLLGRVWQNREHEWKVDLSDEAIFSRSHAALGSNLRFGYSFPLMQDYVLGVIEFFDDKPTELDSGVQTMMKSVCIQIWQFMSLKLAEEKIEQALYAKRAIAQAILENAPIGIAQLNTNLEFNEVNAAFSRQFGVASDKLPGKSIFDVTTGLPVQDLFAVVRTGTNFRVENLRILFEGVPSETVSQDTCWDLAALPVRDTAGSIVGVVLLTADVTERDLLVRQRDDFVATLTHDLKNPLIGQNRMLDLFIEGALGPLQEKQISMLSLVKISTADMLGLIGNLLETYRYAAGAQLLLLEECELSEIVDACMAQARPLAERKGVRLKSSITGITVMADRTAIKRVVMNLLDNAIKFAGPETDVEFWGEMSRDACVLRIKDRGQGMSKQQLSRLFQRFSQSELGHSASASTGLGLYLCRQIIEGHGGTITCESEVDQGLTFSVSLARQR